MDSVCVTKESEIGQVQWLMPVILATCEAEIRRIAVLGQTGEK
jgi:hypothetical protein